MVKQTILLMKFEGIICPMISPFTLDGKVYVEGLKNLIEFLIKHGCNGLFVCGTYGLGPAMSTDERKKIAELTVEYASGKLDIIINVGSSNIDASIELAKHAEDTGADAVASTAPFYYKYEDEGIYSFFTKLLNEVNIPLFVYNIPSRVGYGISPQLLGKLADEGVEGIKDTSGDIIAFYQYMMAVNQKEFKFLVGTERLLLPSIIAGGHGCVAGLANIFPEYIVELYRLIKEKKYQEAVKKQFFIIDLREVIYSVPNIPGTYAVLKLRGIDVGYPKPPHRPLSENQLNKLITMLKERKLI